MVGSFLGGGGGALGGLGGLGNLSGGLGGGLPTTGGGSTLMGSNSGGVFSNGYFGNGASTDPTVRGYGVYNLVQNAIKNGADPSTLTRYTQSPDYLSYQTAANNAGQSLLEGTGTGVGGTGGGVNLGGILGGLMLGGGLSGIFGPTTPGFNGSNPLGGSSSSAGGSSGLGGLLGNLLGAGLSAYGQSAGTNTSGSLQQQTSGTSQQQQTNNTTQSTNQQQTQSSNLAGTATPTENPLMKAYRESLIPQFHNAMAQAQQPIFGDAQKASYLGGLNDLANASTKHLASTLASRGQLDSGAFEQGAGDIEQNKFNQYGTYLSQLPVEEQQIHNQNIAQLLGLSSGFAGPSPVGQVNSQTGGVTGNTTGNNTTLGTQNTNGQTAGTANTLTSGNLAQGNFLSNLAGNAGNLFAAGGLNLGNIFGRNPDNTGGANDPNSLSSILNRIGYNPGTGTPPIVPANPFGG